MLPNSAVSPPLSRPLKINEERDMKGDGLPFFFFLIFRVDLRNAVYPEGVVHV